MIYRGYRYKIYPDAGQDEVFRHFAGVCRLIYNLALEQRRDHWQRYRGINGRNISYAGQARELTDLRAEFDWIAAVSQTCQQQALRDLDRAYGNFFAGRSGYPRPRRKGRDDAFRFQGREVALRKLNRRWSEVRLPKIGWVRYRDTRALPHGVVIKNATVSLSADGWHLSLALEIPHEAPANTRPTVGIDMGVARAVTLSDGAFFSAPPQMAALERRHRRLQKIVARRNRGSRRYALALRRAVRLKARIARVRGHWLHETTTAIARTYGTVVVEDLAVRNMTASAKGTIEAPGRNVRAKAGLNVAILDKAWGRFRELLAYKLDERGGRLIAVDPKFTSQTCSACGAIDPRSRESQAIFRCVTCGAVLNADHNAAINVLRRNTASMRVEGPGCGPDEARTMEEAKQHAFF